MLPGHDDSCRSAATHDGCGTAPRIGVTPDDEPPGHDLSPGPSELPGHDKSPGHGDSPGYDESRRADRPRHVKCGGDRAV